MPTENKARGRNSAKKNLSEHEIIELMRKRFTPMPNIALGFGDDASAVYLDTEGKVAVLKTDMLVAKTDVPIGMSLWQAARKAIVMNVSDFAAKGVQPQTVLVSLGLPKGMSHQDIQLIADGLDAGAREYDAFVVGGDTGEASDLVIAVELFGVADKDSMMLRRGTRPGDILAVTGLFGRSAAGLWALQNKNPVTSKTLEKRLQESVNMPHARLKEGLALAGSRAVSACMDSSDGLAWCLHEMATQNDIGFVISDLPMDDQAAKFALDNRLQAEDLTLYGGEEYELVLTVRPELWDKAASSVEKVGGKLLNIGKATTDKRILLQEKNGEKRPIERRGYEHFKN